MRQQRVVIIGAGLGGLSSGLMLQQNGYDVTILEQGAQIGGCLQCFRRGGVKFETGMHFIGSARPGQTVHQMLRYLGIDSSVILSELDPLGYDTVLLAGETFRFPSGREAFVKQLAHYFPKERDGLQSYVDTIDTIARASTLSSLTSEGRDQAAATVYQTISINEQLDKLFRDELLKKVLVGNLPLYAAERDKTPFAQHAFIFDFYNQSAHRIVGGSDAIAKSLVQRFNDLGGRVLTSKQVAQIVCDRHGATGVLTVEGELFPADQVISTVHPERLMEMLQETSLIRPAFRERLSNIPNTVSCFTVFLKFKPKAVPYMTTNIYSYRADSPWGCEFYSPDSWPKGYLYMHLAHEQQPHFAESGVLISYMQWTDVAQWAGTRIGHRGEAYEAFKQAHAERLLATVEADFPGLSRQIDCFYTATPLTYQDYTGTARGAMYGVAKDFHLGAAGRVPYRTKIPNLYLAGQNVNAHGFLGTLVGSLVTCSALVPAETIFQQIREANR